MKRIILLGAAVLSLVGITSCDKSVSSSKGDVDGKDKVVLYSGIVPGADTQGSVYTLRLDYDDDNNFTDGDYIMTENTLVADTVAEYGFKQLVTSYSEGDFKKERKQVGGTTVEYLRLVPDGKDALGVGSSSSGYFLVNADGSLTMTDASLAKPANAADYTLGIK